MTELFSQYHSAILVLGGIASLLLLQILVADFISIKNKHTPGMPVEDGHQSFMFRSARAAANTNETLGAFIAALLFCILLQAPANAVNLMALIYAAGRVGHMLCYYADWRLARSAMFVVSFAGIVGLAIVGYKTLL